MSPKLGGAVFWFACAAVAAASGAAWIFGPQHQLWTGVLGFCWAVGSVARGLYLILRRPPVGRPDGAEPHP